MKVFSFAFILVFTAYSLAANATPWQPAEGNVQIPIWPNSAPGGQIVTGPEDADLDTVGLVAGRPWMYVHDVIKPTMTIYSPKAKNTGVTVVVFPGGGYQVLAIDLEGTEVCDWLTCFGKI